MNGVEHFLRTRAVQFVEVQSVLILCLSFYTLFLLLVRRWTSNYREKKKNLYSEVFVGELYDAMEKGAGPTTQMSFTFGFQSRIARDAILEQVKLLHGPEKTFLVERYRAYGFLDIDLAKAKSPFWTARLGAATRLGYLSLNETAPVFSKLMRDRNSIVAIAATLALTALDHPLNDANLINLLPSSALGRLNALYEIIHNIGKRHGPPVLIKHLTKTKNPLILEACIRALAQLKTLESIQALRNCMNTPTDLSEDLVAEILNAFSIIGDPGVADIARRYLTHPSAKIRAKSARFLILMNDEESMPSLRLLENDPNIEIQRVIHQYFRTGGFPA